MTHSSKAASLYGRFIPKEEISQVSAWTFDGIEGQLAEVPKEPGFNGVDRLAHTSQQTLSTPAWATKPKVQTQQQQVRIEHVPTSSASTELALAEPQALPMQPLPESPAPAVDVDAIKQAALSEGFDQGYAAGCVATEERLHQASVETTQQIKTQFDAILNQYNQQLGVLQQQMAQEVLLMACELARQVVRKELALDPQSIMPVVQEATAMLLEDHGVATVHIHPADYSLLEQNSSSALGGTSFQWQSDEHITQGGCTVVAAGQTVDSTLEKRWLKAVSNLGLALPWVDSDEAE